MLQKKKLNKTYDKHNNKVTIAFCRNTFLSAPRKPFILFKWILVVLFSSDQKTLTHSLSSVIIIYQNYHLFSRFFFLYLTQSPWHFRPLLFPELKFWSCFHFVSSSKKNIFNPNTKYTGKVYYIRFHCSICRWKTKTTPFALAARFINHLNVN